MNWEALMTPFNMTLGILVVASFFFMRGKVRSDIVALCTLLALMLTDILTPGEALAGFSNTVVIMMVGLFIVGAGIFRTGLAKMISSRILKLAKGNENALLILSMLVTAGVGAFVSNTGTVAVMMPIVISMAAGAGVSPRRYLMPVAFASSLGMFTLISTPPNLVIQEAIVQNGYKPLSFFAFAPIGAIALVVGLGVMFFLSKLLIKKDDASLKEKRSKSLSELVEEYSIDDTINKLTIQKGSPLIGRTIGEMKVATTYYISIIMVARAAESPLRHTMKQSTLGRSMIDSPIGKTIMTPISTIISPITNIVQAPFQHIQIREVATTDTILQEGDKLYCRGSRDHMERFAIDNKLTFDKLDSKEIVDNFENIGTVEVFILPGSKLINKTIAESNFRELYNVEVLGIKPQGDNHITEFKTARLHAGDALLIQGDWEAIHNLGNMQDDMLLVGQPEQAASKVTLDSKAPIAAAIMATMIAFLAFDVLPAVTTILGAAVLMVITRCLRNMEEAYDSINWSSIVLIGAMIPMATAFEKTGVTSAISHFLLNDLGDIGPMGLLAIIYLCTSVLTLFLSNTATAILFTPIAMHAASSMDISPYPFLFAVAVAASMCFASPYSTPPNALVMSAGRYSFMDYVRVGLPLQLIIGVIMVLLLPLLFPFHAA